MSTGTCSGTSTDNSCVWAVSPEVSIWCAKVTANLTAETCFQWSDVQGKTTSNELAEGINAHTRVCCMGRNTYREGKDISALI